MCETYLDEKIRCPHCGHVESLHGYDVLGADDNHVFCNHCHRQVDWEAAEVAKEENDVD